MSLPVHIATATICRISEAPLATEGLFIHLRGFPAPRAVIGYLSEDDYGHLKVYAQDSEDIGAEYDVQMFTHFIQLPKELP